MVARYRNRKACTVQHITMHVYIAGCKEDHVFQGCLPSCPGDPSNSMVNLMPNFQSAIPISTGPTEIMAMITRGSTILNGGCGALA
jgi:hypothetical protein